MPVVFSVMLKQTNNYTRYNKKLSQITYVTSLLLYTGIYTI